MHWQLPCATQSTPGPRDFEIVGDTDGERAGVMDEVGERDGDADADATGDVAIGEVEGEGQGTLDGRGPTGPFTSRASAPCALL
jgi:hypothetical protein